MYFYIVNILLWYLSVVSTSALVAVAYIGWNMCRSRNETITFVLENSDISAPQRATDLSAGYDLRSTQSLTIRPGERAAVKTGVKVVLPTGTYGRIASRSGLSFKNGIEVGAGVVDADYDNFIMVILHNHGSEDFVVEKNHRIAQLVVERISYCKSSLSNSTVRPERGMGGLGSTGLE